MSYGLFGTLTRESDKTMLGIGSSTEDDIIADSAYLEAVEITNETANDAVNIAQAIAISDHMDSQRTVIEDIQNNGQTNVGVAVMTRESMDLAMVALGGSVSTTPMSDIIAHPASYLETTTEDIGSTLKKVYETIKNVFKRLIMNIKKLAAKVVVFMNNTGKKAEKLHKAFKARKTAVAKESKIDDKDKKYVEALSGIKSINTGLVLKNEESFTPGKLKPTLEILSANVTTLVEEELLAEKDNATLMEKFEEYKKKNSTIPDDSAMNSALRLVDGLKSYRYLTAQNVSRNKKWPSYLESSKLVGTSKFFNSKSIEHVDDLPDDAIPETLTFAPTYVKKGVVHGLWIYAEKLDDDEKENTTAILKSIKYKSGSIDVLENNDLSDVKVPVLSKDDILKGLSSLKTASKDLKSFSDARFKEIDKLNKMVDKLGTSKYIPNIFQRIAVSNTNRLSMFATGHFVSSIFAAANLYKQALAELTMYMRYYDE